MRIAILYTSHRQFLELDFMSDFFARSSRLKDVDILFHCNNPDISEASLREKLLKLPVHSLQIRHAPEQNEGAYPYGQFEAVVDFWNQVELSKWDWLIHLHPDVFITDERPVLAALERAESESKDMVVTKPFGHRAPSFATDFFAFKPKPAFKAIFESYLPLLRTPTVVPLENLFFTEVHRARANYLIADRFGHGHYHRDVDRLGLWHEHHLSRVHAYLRKPSSRWWCTLGRCLSRPRPALRTAAVWAGRRLYRVPQDSLAKQCTAI